MKVFYVAIALFLFLLLSAPRSMESISPPKEGKPVANAEGSSETMSIEEETMKTEIATVQDIRNDTIILQNDAGESYCILGASQFKFTIKTGQRLIFTYTEKSPSENGSYTLTVKWLGDMSHYDPINFIHGS